MRYSIYILLNAKNLATDLAILAYGNRQNAIKFARANNSIFASAETFNRNQALLFSLYNVHLVATM